MPSLAALLALGALLQDPSSELPAPEAWRLAAASALRAGDLERAARLPAADAGAMPEWYRSEIDALERALAALAALDAEERAAAGAALALDRGTPPEELLEAERLLADLLGEESRATAEARMRRSEALADRGRFDEAIAAARAGLALAEGPADAARHRAWLGQLLRDVGRLEEGERELRAAVAAWEELGAARARVCAPESLRASGELAHALEARGAYAEAEPLFVAYVQGVRERLGEDHPDLLIGLHNLGANLWRQGDLVTAEALTRESIARKLERFGPDHDWVAYGRLQLGLILVSAGRVDDACDAYRDALSTFLAIDGAETTRVAWCRYRIAEALAGAQRVDAARAAAEEAWASARVAFAELPYERSVVAGVLGRTLSLEGRHERAIEVLEEVVETRRQVLGPEHRVLAHGLLELAAAHAAAGDDEAALPLLEEAETILVGEDRGGGPYLADARTALGRCLAALGRLEPAGAALERAALSFEAARGRHAVGLERSSFGVSPYPDLAAVRARQGRAEDAWDALERGRARSLLERIAADADEGARRLSEEIVATRARIDALATAGEDAAPRLVEARAELYALEAEAAWSASMETREPCSRERVQAALLPDEAVVTWCLDAAGPALFGLVLRAEGPPRLVPLGPAGDLARLARERVDRLASEARSPFAGAADAGEDELGELCFGGIVASGALEGARHLVVVPGELEGVPLEALRVGDAFVGERWSTSYVVSAGMHALLRERRAAAGDALLAVGDPAPARGKTGGHLAALRSGPDLAALPRLPRAREEVRAIAASFPEARVLVGEDASEAELDRLASSGGLRRFGTIHLAAHALVDAERPERSGVVLSQANLPDPVEAALRGEAAPDGFLSSAEVVARWRLDAELVALSGCRTALGASLRGEGFVGLATAFQRAGARSLLVSLWEVEDEATLKLMRAFYARWRDDRDLGPRAKAEALRRARGDLRAEGGRFASPSRWAAFVLTGDPG